jgi:cytochrome c oxidase subunit 3
VEPFQTVGPFWLPTINTALLLTSGVTLTIAHHALRRSARPHHRLHVAR